MEAEMLSCTPKIEPEEELNNEESVECAINPESIAVMLDTEDKGGMTQKLRKPRRRRVKKRISNDIKNDEFIINNSKRNSILKCDICDETLKNNTALQLHIITTHFDKQTSYHKTQNDITENDKYQNENDKYQNDNDTNHEQPYCKLCDKHFASMRYLNRHINYKKCTPKENFECKICHKILQTVELCQTHIKMHKRYTCDVCNEHFKLKQELLQHYKTAHNIDRPFRCDICQKAFRLDLQLAAHASAHSDARPYFCQKCGKTFKQRQTALKHKEIHLREKKLDCDLCGRVFPRPSRLKYHMKTHTKEQPFSCDLCTKKFAHKTNVIRHLISKHPQTLSPKYVEMSKEKIRKWNTKRNFGKTVLESLKYCIINTKSEQAKIESDAVQNVNHNDDKYQIKNETPNVNIKTDFVKIETD